MSPVSVFTRLSSVLAQSFFNLRAIQLPSLFIPLPDAHMGTPFFIRLLDCLIFLFLLRWTELCIFCLFRLYTLRYFVCPCRARRVRQLPCRPERARTFSLHGETCLGCFTRKATPRTDAREFGPCVKACSSKQSEEARLSAKGNTFRIGRMTHCHYKLALFSSFSFVLISFRFLCHFIFLVGSSI